MVEKKYIVLRPHIGDRQYNAGDFRVAYEADVSHLVAAGTLAEVASVADKAAPPLEVKPYPQRGGRKK